jgi:Type VI secretion system/phage-baseplate injector OB domain
MNKFYGKYRGKVANNIDPMQLGRIQVSVPSVLGDGSLSWAMPCVPFAGSGVGFFMIPPNDANVWVEFERGDIDYPIWTGCFWGVGEVPATPAVAEVKVIKTADVTLTLSDLPGVGGCTIELKNGQKIKLGSLGVEIVFNQTRKINLEAMQVSINGNALEVM